MTNTGKLRNLVTLQTQTTTQDDTGATSQTWTDLASVWAEVKATGGREALIAQQLNAAVTVSVRIRYRAGVVAAMRIVFGARVFDIEAVLDLDGCGRYLNLLCAEAT